MDFYEGLRRGADKPKGGGAYVKEEGFGHEIFNFRKDDDGKFRGYVRPPGSGRVRDQRINIDRLGAASGDDAITGVTVFWAATHPALGGTRIVGWYDDATVHRGWRPSPKKRVLPNGDDAGFMIEASKAHLIPSDDRLRVLPRATARTTGIGQSNVWYPPDDWAAKLLEYKRKVATGQTMPKRRPKHSAARMADTEARLRIERAAMQAAIQWCIDRGLRYEDVSLKKVGWDIEAGEGKGILRIEVKGSSLSIGSALLELTPNEFAKMVEYRDSFRLAVVAVTKGLPQLVMFAWSHDAGAWIANAGQYALKLHEVVSARVEICTSP